MRLGAPWALGGLAVVVAMVGTPMAPARAAAASAPPRVVVVGVPDLRWSDLDARTTPALWRLTGVGAAGALSVRAGRAVSRCLDGWLTLGAGNRARSGPVPLTGSCADTVPAPTPAGLGRLQRGNGGTGFGVRVGALGQALHAAGLRTAAVGDAGAALAVADRSGRVDVVTTDLHRALATAAVTVVADDALFAAAPPARPAAAAHVDGTVAAVLAAAGSRADVLVVATGDAATGAANLHVATAAGPDFGAGLLSSASTGRAPFVQLIDVAPTVLRLLRVPVPAAMIGEPWSVTGDPATPAVRVHRMRDLAAAARTARGVSGAFRVALIWTDVGLLLLAGWLLRAPHRAARVLVPLLYAAAALPVASWLAQLLPWWRRGGGLFAALLLGFAGVIGAAATIASAPSTAAAAGRRRGAWAGLAVCCGVTAAVLAVDLVTGSRLQLTAALGDSPLIAGRFHGAGNAAFAAFAASALVVAGGLHALLRRRPGTAVWALPAAAAIAGAAVVIDGAPAFGDDFGGVLALGPAAALLLLLLAGRRLRVRGVLLALAAGLVPVTAFALYDYSRAPSAQTHLGRFVGQLLHGGAADVVRRKAAANVHQVFGSGFLWLLLAGAAFAVALLADGRLLRAHPGLRPVLLSVLTAGVLGGLLNDSGVVVPGVMVAVVLPALAAAALGGAGDLSGRPGPAPAAPTSSRTCSRAPSPPG